jgi:hypothetical protein
MAEQLATEFCMTHHPQPEIASKQNYQILAHLQEGKAITPLEALNSFGTFRLAARIYDLRKAGYDIRCRKVRVAKGKSVAEYCL